ncbi:hypothetical protein BcDW1_9631 [Botrytis cinerea BcDW1]|uniref:Uncharacterized protein n=1 Tax=Botryotinia fuckeliana (strain BcDW1) TaxID=1290391 RepID=M7U555_BOTF1|nr:hypothetical protein BcDW1_9631 [Botrytis cinerea BcDW1]
MSSPLSSPGVSPGSAADSTRGDSESIESPVFNSSNRATSKKTTAKKTTVKNTTAKKTTVKNNTAKKTISKKTTVKKTTAKKKTISKKTTNEKIPSEMTAAEEAIAVQSPNETNKRDYSVAFKPQQYNAHKLNLYHIFIEKRIKVWREFGKKEKIRVPLGDAQYIWVQTQPKEIRDKVSVPDREGTTHLFGTYLERERKVLHNGVLVEDSTPVHYLSQFIEDHHTPIPEHERNRKRLPNTFTFRTYFPESATVLCALHFQYDSSQMNVQCIETVLETKSKESFELKARIKEEIERRKRRRAEASEEERLAKAAMGFTVPPQKDLRVGLECRMISDDGLLME